MMPRNHWMDHAACQGENLELFFLPRTPRETEYALAVCDGCPVKLDCQDHALDAGITDGIWGGLDEAELDTLHRKRDREVADVS